VQEPRVLVVEDDLGLRDVLARGLREEGFTVVGARDGAAALLLADEEYAAVVLDIGLPDADGRDVCQALRARGVDAPVLFLTARDGLPDRLSGFAAGGDDYLTKPFHFSELLARLRALVRRPAAATPSDAAVRLDPGSHAVSSADGTRVLTPTEYRLLGALLAAPGRVVRRQELVRAAWPDGARVHDNTLDQYVSRLRRKLAEVGAPETISTARGVGYRYA
jgi:two-component system response regulator MprA